LYSPHLDVDEKTDADAEVRVDTTNNNTDWTKTIQSHTSLVHDARLTNPHHAKRHATNPPYQTRTRSRSRSLLRSIAAQVEFERAKFETGFSLDRCKG
jgi:hypothetical protein